MQYRLKTSSAQPDVTALAAALLRSDPAALIDFDRRAAEWRVSTVLPGEELLRILGAGGLDAATVTLRPVPSECCGGCGG